MPWHLDANRAGCDGVAVVKDTDGSIAGCHPNEAAAKAQLAALYANELSMAAAMSQPLDPTPGMPDPQVLQDEFEAAPPGPDWLPDFPDGTPCWGVALAEGVPDGSAPRRLFEPGAVTFAPTPFSIKWSPEGEHEDALVAARVDYIWRDGSLIRWIGAMDSFGAAGAEAERLIAGKFLHGISPLTDDIDGQDVEIVWEVGAGPELGGPEEYHYPGKHNQKDHGRGGFGNKPSKRQRDAAAARIKARGDRFLSRENSVDGAVVAHGDEMPDVPMPVPEMLVYKAGRIRSLTILPEQAFVEACIYLGTSPYPPTPEAIAGRRVPGEPDAAAPDLALKPADEIAMTEPIVETITAAAYQLTIPDLWPESWFQEPSAAEMAMVSSGAIQVTPEGRVWGLLAPAGVDHRGFRGGMGRVPQVPRGIDYSEWQNKGCIVAGADGNAYKINAGTVTFDCGHASPSDPRRADPNFASQHYDNSCSVAMRARCGENRYGTWFAGGLVKGLTASSFQQIMGCALSGDWQGGKLKAALLVPVEGFPQAVTASVRERMGTLVASSVPIVFDAPPVGPSPDFLAGYDFALAASARFDELAAERFDELAREEVSDGR